MEISYNNTIEVKKTMSISKAQKAAVSRYISTHYEQIVVRVPKGNREKFKEIADNLTLSLNQLIIRAVTELARENALEHILFNGKDSEIGK